MSITIRIMNENDKGAVIEMMRTFYSSPAVWSNGSEEIFQRDVENCVNDNPYLDGYVFEEDGVLQGYAMLAKSFSTEFGKHCIWIEDIYMKDACRGKGVARRFFEYLEKKYQDVVFRLEVEEENERAVNIYKKAGYEFLPYEEMIKK